MAAIDKLELLKTGFSMLVDVLRPTDNIAIVVYSGREEVVLHSTSCEEANKTKIKEVIASLRAEGSTAGAAALKTAYEIASRYFVTGGNNRIILGTDGDFKRRYIEHRGAGGTGGARARTGHLPNRSRRGFG